MYRVQAAAIQQDLARVGIAVDVRSSELLTLLSDARAGQFPALHAAVGRRHRSGHAAARVSLQAGGADRLEPRVLQNPDVDRLIDAAAAAGSEPERKALYADAQRRIAADVPYISLWYKTNVAVAQPDLRGCACRRLPTSRS